MKMDNYLTALYFEKFELTRKETLLMSNTDFPSTEDGTRNNIRNDQSITEVRKQNQMLVRLITKYIEKLKSE